jgi:hypothetical protein
MPRKATVPCTVCGKPRIVGGKTKPGPCWDEMKLRHAEAS